MGAYLSTPSTEIKSDDFSESEKLSYGASRMQGWRISMEDAHSCIPGFTDNDSLFGVYDGHGGSEVALYCALHLSDTLKNLDSYKEGKYETALKEAFMALDEKLLKPEVIRELKVLAERDLDDKPPTAEDIQNAEAVRQDEEECEEDEMAMLHEEATMSIEELLSRYGQISNATKKALKKKPSDDEAASSEQESQSSSALCSSTDEKPGSSSSHDEKEELTKKVEIPSPSSEGALPESSSQAPSSSLKEEPELSARDIVKASSPSGANVLKTDELKPSSSSHVIMSADSTNDDDAPKPSISDEENPEQSSEISSSEQTKSDSSTDIALKKSTKSSEKLKPGKINPKGQNQIKFGLGDDGDFEPELSGSDSEEDGFDSDEAVEGSSESEDDDTEDDDSDDEDPDVIEIPTLRSIATTTEEAGKDSGTTAVVAFMNNYELFVANAGDSRCVLCRDGKAFDMSDDHKPEDEKELSRIKTAGGYVAGGRVNGGLNLSRAIGDHCYKLNKDLELENQIISAMPDVKKVSLRNGDKFMVLACDGIWNSLSSQDVIDFVLAKLPASNSEEKVKLSVICEELMMKCLAPDTSGDGSGCDNMTCIIVKFNEDWLAKSPAKENPDGNEVASVNAKTDDGSGEAGTNQTKVNGISCAENGTVVKGLKRQLETAPDNGQISGTEPKIQKVG